MSDNGNEDVVSQAFVMRVTYCRFRLKRELASVVCVILMYLYCKHGCITRSFKSSVRGLESNDEKEVCDFENGEIFSNFTVTNKRICQNVL